MGSSRRRTVGIALGALLASPVIALLDGPVASADDLSTIGPYTADGYTDTFTYSDAYAFDNYLSGSYADLDIYSAGPGSGDSEVLLTVPLLFQGGLEDVDGTITPFYSFDSADFVSPDVGLADLGGTPTAGGGIETFGPFDVGGYTDTLNINSDTFGLDDLLTGATHSLPFDLDLFSGGPGSDSSEFVLTVPSLFQVGLEDVAGALTPIFSLDPADFVSPDIGLTLLG
jgi:hypothetical protein